MYNKKSAELFKMGKLKYFNSYLSKENIKATVKCKKQDR